MTWVLDVCACVVLKKGDARRGRLMSGGFDGDDVTCRL
jgi:hypothetical protein